MKFEDLKIGQKIKFKYIQLHFSQESTSNTIIIGLRENNIICSEIIQEGTIYFLPGRESQLVRDNIDKKYHKYVNTMAYINSCNILNNISIESDLIDESYTEGYKLGYTGLKWL